MVIIGVIHFILMLLLISFQRETNLIKGGSYLKVVKSKSATYFLGGLETEESAIQMPERESAWEDKILPYKHDYLFLGLVS